MKILIVDKDTKQCWCNLPYINEWVINQVSSLKILFGWSLDHFSDISQIQKSQPLMWAAKNLIVIYEN